MLLLKWSKARLHKCDSPLDTMPFILPFSKSSLLFFVIRGRHIVIITVSVHVFDINTKLPD